MSVKLFTDKLVFRRLEVPRGWSLDSAIYYAGSEIACLVGCLHIRGNRLQQCNEKFENCRKVGKFALPAETTR